MSECRYILGPKYPRKEMFPCRNFLVTKIPCAENFLRQNGHGDEISMCQNVCGAKSCTCQNVPVMKYLCQNVSFRNVRFRSQFLALFGLCVNVYSK